MSASDYFIRAQLNSLTGLTRYAQDEGVLTTLVDGAWTTIYQLLATQEHNIFAAYGIELTPEAKIQNPEFRILAAKAGVLQPADLLIDDLEAKIFPFSSSTEVMSGMDQLLQWPLQVPMRHDVYFQVRATNLDPGGTIIKAKLSYLSKIKVPLFEHD